VLFVMAASVLAAPLAIAQAPPQQAHQIYVTPAGARLVDQGLAAAAPAGSDAAAFQDVPAPSLRNAPNSGYAQATLAPWVESNGWRFQRGIRKASYRILPRGSAGLATAEAFAFDVDAILNPDPADIVELGAVLEFLKAHRRPTFPPLANVGVIDDGSPAMGEVLNMLTRRNLLYRVVSGPDRTLAFTVRLGTGDFPQAAAANPSDFAARVRERIGDDNRLVRIYGSTTAIVRLSGDNTRARLVVLSYSRNRMQQDVRIRLLGGWRNPEVAAYGAARAAAIDVEQLGKSIEFTIPTFSTIAIVDLTR
jgi:hypothetical protein